MIHIVGTRAEAPVAEQNHNCSPILSDLWRGCLPLYILFVSALGSVAIRRVSTPRIGQDAMIHGALSMWGTVNAELIPGIPFIGLTCFMH